MTQVLNLLSRARFLAEGKRIFLGNCEALAKPFEWKFTRKNLDDLLRRMKTPGLPRDQLVA